MDNPPTVIPEQAVGAEAGAEAGAGPSNADKAFVFGGTMKAAPRAQQLDVSVGGVRMDRPGLSYKSVSDVVGHHPQLPA